MSNNKKDPRIKIIIMVFVLTIVGGIGLGIWASSSEELQTSEIPRIEVTGEKIQNWGEISMADGDITKNFEFTNTGNGNLKVMGIQTSCMCTDAVLKVGDRKSPRFSMHKNPSFWSEEIAPGEKAILEVTFDPNAHGPDATGSIVRDVYMTTNEGGGKFTFRFTGEVVK